MDNKTATLAKVAASEKSPSTIISHLQNDGADILPEWALAYAAIGHYVFPCRARKKEPLTEHGWKDATTDPDIIRDWWLKWPDANIGIACGPSNIVVIDLDSSEALRAVKMLGLPQAPHARTNAGWHLYCSADQRRPLQSRVGVLLGLDVRAMGGYVIAPPSVHPSGIHYEWAPGRSLWDIPLPPVPQWLYEKAPQPGNTDIARLANGAPDGMRDVSLTSVCGHLLARRVEPHLAEALVYAYGREMCDPPLDDKQIQKIWQSIATRELRRRQQKGRG